MTLYVCSLKVTKAQTVPVDPDYHLVRFPYGAAESWDPHNMHPATQPDGTVSLHPDARSGLIWPCVAGWASLIGIVFWEAGQSSEYRGRFIRDPLSLTTGYDSTATRDDAPTPGGQYKTYHHEMVVHPRTPVGFAVRHNATSPLDITLAEFKVAIETGVAAIPEPPPYLVGRSLPDR
ncbi:hypothetical protein ACFFMN_23660 [Planobispora siamensis]|nr:hypothetical protein [Planobispora siamensis]